MQEGRAVRVAFAAVLACIPIFAEAQQAPEDWQAPRTERGDPDFRDAAHHDLEGITPD